MKPFKRIQEIRGAAKMPTYEAGLIQARAYRILEQNLQTTLRPFGITHAEWGLMGAFVKRPMMNITEISQLLGVTKPMATTMVAKMEQKNVLKRSDHKTDSRYVMVELTDNAIEMIPEVEVACRTSMRDLLKEVNRRDLLAYLRVLETIAE